VSDLIDAGSRSRPTRRRITAAGATTYSNCSVHVPVGAQGSGGGASMIWWADRLLVDIATYARVFRQAYWARPARARTCIVIKLEPM
jgi:hypothetical protein